MNYVSTRGQAPALGFEDALLAGLADDGGLYVPSEWPSFTHKQITAFAGLSYQALALEVMYPFVAQDITRDVFADHIAKAYGSFRHKAITPLNQLGPDMWLLELFHGPTLAFKDVALQLLARLMESALAKRNRHATIVGATSGDTGSAAIEAFKNCTRADIFILHPKGRVSDVQRRQMTTVKAPNVHNIALEGTFDDCQLLVKQLFADTAFREEVNLGAVNSINWARVMAQVVYYFAAAVSLGAPSRAVRFAVPTGNFGDIFAGYVASKMGLPIERLVIGTNVNDILDRTLKTGRYELSDVIATMSPSIDIQVSSNFERLLFDMQDGDGARVRSAMSQLSQGDSFALDDVTRRRMNDVFSSSRASEQDTKAMIAHIYEDTGMLVDPHTAVGLVAAYNAPAPKGIPLVSLATAHGAKFPDAVRAATGIEPPLPAFLQDIMAKPEYVTVLKNDLGAVKRHVLEKRGTH